MHAYLSPGLRLRVNAWRMLYRSTSAVGEPVAVSGSVLVPCGRTQQAAAADRIRRSARTGSATRRHRRGCCPVASSGRPALISMLLARGWAVAITDYQGLGTPGDHTYMVGRALGPNVLDSMRAARQLVPEHLPEEGPAAIIGYSEGGAAAAWAAQLQPTYAPDVPLVARGRGRGSGRRRDRGSEPRRHLLLVLHGLRRDRLRRRLPGARARPLPDPGGGRAGGRACASPRSSRPCCGRRGTCGPPT